MVVGIKIYSTTCSWLMKSKSGNSKKDYNELNRNHGRKGTSVKYNKILDLATITALITLIVVFSSCISTSYAAREWETRPHNYTVSEEPWFVPYLSEKFGLMIPWPEQIFNFEVIVGKPYDFYISKPKEDWYAYQPMWLGGCNQGPLGVLMYEPLRVLQQLETWVRDIIDTVLVIVKLVVCIVLQVLSFVDSRAERIMLEQSVWDLPMTQSNPKFYPKSRDLPMSKRYEAGTVLKNKPLLFKFIFEWDTYKVFPRGLLDKFFSSFFSSGEIPEGKPDPEWKPISNRKKEKAPSKDGPTPAPDGSSTPGASSTPAATSTAAPATTDKPKSKAQPGPEMTPKPKGKMRPRSTPKPTTTMSPAKTTTEEEEVEYYDDGTEGSRRKRESLPLLRAKRERIDDRLMEYSLPETEIFRCEKRGLEIIGWLVLDFFKAWYHFFPLINKLYFRIGEGVAKIIIEYVRWFLWPDVIGLDVAICYKIDAFFHVKPPMLGPLCKGVLKTVFELIMDVADLANEDLFVEALDVIDFFAISHDNRITYHELDIYSNVTHIKAADSVDKVRFDGTARIDDYYRDYASKIQCFEKPLRMYDRDPETKLLKRVKYEWCLAVYTPPVNPLYRIEYKAMWMSRVFKNDHILDIGEFQCLTGPYLDNLVFNAWEEKNCTYIISGIPCIQRVYERLDDIIQTMEILHMDETVLTHNIYLNGVVNIILAMQKILIQNPFERTLFELTPMVYDMIRWLDIALYKALIAEKSCFSVMERRMRVKHELQILGEMMDLNDLYVPNFDNALCAMPQ